MSDLVERLRDVRKRFESGTPQFTDQLEFVTSEAADTIERLQARVAELESQNERLQLCRRELAEVTEAMDDPTINLTRTLVEAVEALRARVAGLEAQARQLRWLRERTQNVLAGRHGDQLIMHPEEYLRATLALLDAAAEERP